MFTVGGIVEWNGEKFVNHPPIAGETNEGIVIWSKSGAFWYAKGQTVYRYKNNQISEYHLPNAPEDAVINKIVEDARGRIWVGTKNAGLFVLENEKLTAYAVTDKLGISPRLEDSSGNLWFASNKGVFLYRNGAVTNITTNDGLASDDCKIILEACDGTIWIGTYGGLTRFRNGAFSSFTTNDGLASNQVRSLYEDSAGVLWIGSYDGGLTRFKDGRFTRYTTREGLFNNSVFQILEDASGNFWMSSNRGIFRVAKQQLNDFADGKINYIESIAYGKADGLLETECNGGQQPAGIKASDGKLWFPVELHDSLGQQLPVIKNWAMLEIVAKGEDNQSREALGEISDTASQAIEEVREIIYDLRPYQLDKIGLRKTILFMVEKIAAASNIEFTTEIDEIDNLFDYDSEIVLYRIVQECLNNIVKHSQATAAVIIERNGRVVNLLIEDNGRGFTLDSVGESQSNGFGLTGIGERVRMLGGNRTIVTAPAGGAKISISITVDKNNEFGN